MCSHLQGTMNATEEWNESLENIDDLISCMGSLEQEDIIYLDKYLVEDTSPVHSPSHWLTTASEEGKQDRDNESDESRSIVEGLNCATFDNPDDPELIIDLPRDENSAQMNASHDGNNAAQPNRSTRGITKPRFVSYEHLPGSKGKTFLCELCGLRLSTRESRRRHILAKHIKEKNNTCDVCGKSFIFKFTLKAHKAVHSEVPSFTCVCGRSFSARASYMDHIKRIHRAASKIKYPCELCFKSFGDRQTLRIHLISVHKPKTIVCTHNGCNNVFSTVGLMRNHYRYHLNKKFECDECGQSFSTESYMYKHRLTHSGIRPYVCIDCGKTYMSASHLNTHRRMAHSSARPFQCSLCGKCYKTKDQVIFHESSHKGEKPFQCTECGYATAYKNTYYAHRKKHKLKAASQSATIVEKNSIEAENLQRQSEIIDKVKKVPNETKGKGKVKYIKTNPVNRNKSTGGCKVGTGRKDAQSHGNRKKFSQISSASKKIAVHKNSSEKSIPKPTELKQKPVLLSSGNPLNIPDQLSKSKTSTLTSDNCRTLESTDPLQFPHSSKEKVDECSKNVFCEELQAVGVDNREKDNTDINEKQNSCIILSSSGKCALPTCESGDDSLLLLKVGENSFLGICHQHVYSGNSNESSKEMRSEASQDVEDRCSQNLEQISFHINDSPREESSALPGFDLKENDVDANVCDTKTDSENQAIALLTLPFRYEKGEVEIEQSVSQVSDLETNLLKNQCSLETSQSEDTDTVKMTTNGVYQAEDISPMVELDTGVTSLSGHIVDDALSFAEIEVICPLCDEQFLCMDAYITHLECSHNE